MGVKRSNCSLSGRFFFQYNYLFRYIPNNSLFLERIKRNWILLWDICHLFWDTGYLSKNYFGIFEKNNSGKQDIWGHLLWDIGYPLNEPQWDGNSQDFGTWKIKYVGILKIPS